MHLCCSTWLVAVGGLVCVTSSSETDGFNNAAVIGRRLLVLLLNSRCAGLICILTGSVFLWSSKARNACEPVLLHFNKIFFACLTVHSAFPFD